MRKKLAIRGHSMRGKEVIELLEMMGGKNIREHKYDGSSNMYSYYISNDIILNDRLSIIEDDDFIIFTLEEFLWKYPFKIGDKVFDITDGDPGIITAMKWDEDVSDMKYHVAFDNGDMGWYTNDTIGFLKEEKNMNKKLAIKGHPTRGKEVIELLEMMGGVAAATKGFRESYCYYISEDTLTKYISWDFIGPEEINKYKIFTLEEFLEKYPFKVGDKVRIPEYESEVRICEMRWDPLCNYMEYMVYRNDDPEWYNVEELLKYNDNPSRTQPRHMYLFNKHDIVVVESYDKLHKWICEYKSCVIDRLYFYKGTYDIYDICFNEKENKCKLIYDSFYDVAPSDIIRIASPDEIAQFERMIEKNNTTNHMANVLAELLDHIKNTSKEELEKEFNELEEWSHVGPTVEEFMDFCNKVNKKPKYPKLTNLTECKEILGEKDMYQGVSGYKGELLTNFQRLIIFRDVYWKIAGEAMGLDGLWKPDWLSGRKEEKYCIATQNNEIWHNFSEYGGNEILAFPTIEMRDAFYENFKDLIESCKELL